MKPRLHFDPAVAVAHLRDRDATLAALIERVGPFALELKPAASLFEAMLRSIVYQQLHGKAAATIHGRVLVERLEGFCTEADWRRAYSEINQFERQLTDYGTIVFKFWMHISKQEQLRRFRERTKTNYKTWKITDEDWRNRGKWEDYITAAEEMLLKTSTPDSPWTLVEANDKHFARIKTLRTVAEKLRQELK